MTRYEYGFMNKCAEHGLGASEALDLLEKRGFKVTKMRPDQVPELLSKLSKGLSAAAKNGEGAYKATLGRMMNVLPSWGYHPNGGPFSQLEVRYRTALNKAIDAARKSGKIKDPKIYDALVRSERQINGRGIGEALKHNAGVMANLREALKYVDAFYNPLR